MSVRRFAAAAALFSVVSCTSGQELALPPRPATALTGSQVLPYIQNLSRSDRENVVWHEVMAGNVPPFLRSFVPVTVSATIGGVLRTAVFEVAPDYLGIGADGDWFRMPMSPILAQQICDRLDATMPTRKMVDAIWAQAPVHLAPYPYSPTVYNILSCALFHQHHLQIETQRGGQPLGLIVGGIKKDVVVSALIASWPTRVVIYGWHYQNGVPIQPLSKVHENTYADYSHGIRLVKNRVLVDGQPTTVAAVLADPVLHPLLSDEGAFASSRYVVPPPPETFPFLDAFPAAGRQLGSWRDKFTAPQVQAFAPTSPGGDGHVLVVRDPAGGTESTRLGAATSRDVAVQADLYCEYRPQLAADGFERVGIFARDNAQGAFDGTLSQPGACYALTWDSHDGRLRCLRVQGGVLTDLAPAPVFRASTAWRRIRIEARGSSLRFLVDGALVLAATDAAFPAGEIGIGHHEYFLTNANARGTRADNWFADIADGTTLAFSAGPAPGQLSLDVRRAVPGDTLFTALTLAPGAFPNGWWFGLDIPFPLLLAEAASGAPPFLAPAGPSGSYGYLASGVPPGFAVQGVTLDLDPFGLLAAATAPVAFTMP